MRRVRMHRIRIGVLCLMMVFLLGISWEATGLEKEAGKQETEEMCVPMGMIVLAPAESVEKKKTPVEFPHARHFVYECKACHHKWEGTTQINSCTTSDCHDLLKPPKAPTKYLAYTDTGIKYFKYAFHEKCVGCHKAIKSKRKEMEMSYVTLKEKLPKTGPTGCIECHPKK